MLTGERYHLFDFCGGYIPGINATHSHALTMYLEHDLCRLLAIQQEKLLQNHDHEVHGSVIVIEQHNFKERGSFDLTLLCLNYCTVFYSRRHMLLRFNMVSLGSNFAYYFKIYKCDDRCETVFLLHA